MNITYEQAKDVRDNLEGHVSRLGAKLKEFPRLSNGLTPDSVRAKPEYGFAKRQFDLAFSDLQNFNKRFIKFFKQERVDTTISVWCQV